MRKSKIFVCLIVQRHTILCCKHIFSVVTLRMVNVYTILGPIEIIDGFGNAIIVLLNDTILHIKDALLSNRSKRNLLSFGDVLRNRYHFETINKQNKVCLYITSYKISLKTIHEKLEASPMSLYCVLIQAIESYVIMSWRLINPDEFGL